MEKQAVNMARLAMAAAVVLCLLLATAPQEAAGADQGQPQYLSYDKLISCKALGNCEKHESPEAKRPGTAANAYTRGCSPIHQCRG